MAVIEFENIRKSFGPLEVIKGINVRIEHNEFAVFVGPSGCGKSTILRMLAGLETPTSGEIKIDGEVVNDRRPVERGISMVFQSYALYPHMTVFQNMAFGLKQVKTPKREIEERVSEAAELLQIGELLGRRPKELSGGQRQRVAIGRSIVRKPKVFLFDEPLSNLDAALRGQMRVELGALHERLGATMIYVTHDQVEAMTLADRIVVFRDGETEQIGTPREVYTKPNTKFVAEFLGSPRMNVMECQVVKTDKGGLCRFADGQEIPVGLPVDDGRLRSDATSIGIRPEDMTVSMNEAAGLSGAVKHVEYLGDELLVHVDLPFGKTVIAKSAVAVDPHIGQPITLGASGEACHFFDREGRRVG